MHLRDFSLREFSKLGKLANTVWISEKLKWLTMLQQRENRPTVTQYMILAWKQNI